MRGPPSSAEYSPNQYDGGGYGSDGQRYTHNGRRNDYPHNTLRPVILPTPTDDRSVEVLWPLD